MKLTAISAAFLLIVLAIPALAQDENNEIGFLLGAAVTPSQTSVGPTPARIELGRGTSLQATYARRLTDGEAVSLFVEIPFLATPQIDITSGPAGTTANYAMLFVTPGLRFKFVPNAAVAPWFSVGGGYANFEESPETVNGSRRALGNTHTNTGALQLGGGLDFQPHLKLLLPISFRAEVRDFYSAAPDYNVRVVAGRQHNVIFSGGFVIHF